MPLSEQDRQRLDGIVSQMEANGEPEDNIRFVVSDFKQKYDAPASDGPSLTSRFLEAASKNTPLEVARQMPDFLRGAGAGLVSTALHGGDLIRRATGMERIIDQPGNQAAMKAPDSDAGRAGFVAEQGAEFAIPMAKVTHAAGALPWLGRMAVEGLTSAGVAGVQTGGDKPTMAASAALPVVGSLALKTGGAALRAGQRMAAGAEEGGLGGAVASLVRAAVPAAPKSMLVQALKPRSVKVNFGEALDRAMPELKAVEETLGRPISTVDDLVEAADLAKKANRAQYAQLQGPQHAMGAQVDLTGVADAIESSIPKRVQLANPQQAARSLDLARVYRDGRFTLEEAEQLLREVNADLEAYYAKFPAARAKAAAANPETAQMLAEATELRKAIYAALDAPGEGTAARELQRRYGALMEVQDAAYRRMNVAARQQPESLSEQIGKVRAAADMARGLWKLKSLDISGIGDIAAAKAGASAAKFLKDQQTTDALIRRAFTAFKGARVPVEMPPPVRIAGELPPATIRLGGGPDPSYARAVDAEMGIPLREGEIVPEPAPPARPVPGQLPSGRPGAPALPPASFRMPASTTLGVRQEPPAPRYVRELGLQDQPPITIYRGGARAEAPKQLPERATPAPEPPQASVESSAPAPTKVVKPRPPRGKKAAATTPVDTPAQAAEKVADHLERVIDVSGEKTAGGIQARVMKALEAELPEAEAGAAKLRVMRHGKGKSASILDADNNQIAEIDYDGRVDWATYAPDDLNIPGRQQYKPILKIERYGGSDKQQREALAAVSSALAEHRGVQKIVVRIPGDGTFTIKRTPEAINEVLRRMKSAGPSIWRDLAKGARKGR